MVSRSQPWGTKELLTEYERQRVQGIGISTVGMCTATEAVDLQFWSSGESAKGHHIQVVDETIN